ncbi:hypothetical protein BGW37DRAFT_539205 [Umbelopsis sp. PMI_123]|nr:hypothetical protein BGW37DRAFT_539205 [Umbelopsis sp. PMI_123]
MEREQSGYFERSHDGPCKNFDPYIKTPSHPSWTINGNISVKLPPGRDLVECARRAWVLLRYDSPSIAVVRRRGNGYYYKSPTEAGELEEWVDKTFHVVTTCKATEIASSPIINEKLYNYMPLLFVIPEDDTLVLRIFHDISDRLGIVYALDNLADLLVSDRPLPIFGDEGENLSPCLHHALGLPEPTEEDNKAAMVKLTEHAAIMPGMMLKSSDPTELGFTVSQTVSAAIAMSIKKYLKKEQYADDKKYSVAMNVMAWIHAIDVTTFSNTAQQFKSFTDEHRSQLLTLARTLESYCEAQKNMVFIEPPSTVPMISNSGLLDKKLTKIHIGGKGQLEVTDFWTNLDMYISEAAFSVWTWNGILNVMFSYNDAYYADKMVSNILESSKSFLLIGLQV